MSDQYDDKRTQYKYPSIPYPGNTDDELYATVMALKEAVELLTSRSNARAVSVDLLSGVLGRQQNTNALTGFVTDDWVRAAQDRLNAIFTHELDAVHTTITTEVGQVTDEIRAAIGLTPGHVLDYNTPIADVVNYEVVGITGTRALAAKINDTFVQQITQTGGYLSSIVGNQSITRAAGGEVMATTINNTTAIASKQRTFLQAATPTNPPSVGAPALIIGDLWIDTTAQNQIKRWDGTTWVNARDQQLDISYASLTDTTFVHANGNKAIVARMGDMVGLVGQASGTISNTDFVNTGLGNTVVGRIGQLRGTVGDVSASVVSALGGSVTANGAIAGITTGVSTTVAGHTTTITQQQMSVNGSKSTWSISAVTDGRDGGGLRFSSIVSADGTFNSLFKVDGNAVFTGSLNANRIIAGSITTDRLAAGAVTADKIAAGTIVTDRIAVGGVDLANIVQGAATGVYSANGGAVAINVTANQPAYITNLVTVTAEIKTGVITVLGNINLSGSSAATFQTYLLQVYANGTVWKNVYVPMLYHSYDATNGNNRFLTGSFSTQITFTLPLGYHVIYLRMSVPNSPSNINGSVDSSSIVAIENRR